eukprot:1070892-Prymnesium_polylepis.1
MEAQGGEGAAPAPATPAMLGLQMVARPATSGPNQVEAGTRQGGDPHRPGVGDGHHHRPGALADAEAQVQQLRAHVLRGRHSCRGAHMQRMHLRVGGVLRAQGEAVGEGGWQRRREAAEGRSQRGHGVGGAAAAGAGREAGKQSRGPGADEDPGEPGERAGRRD